MWRRRSRSWYCTCEPSALGSPIEGPVQGPVEILKSHLSWAVDFRIDCPIFFSMRCASTRTLGLAIECVLALGFAVAVDHVRQAAFRTLSVAEHCAA